VKAGGAVAASLVSPMESPQGDGGQPSIPPTSQEEDNYTICHGTPQTHSPRHTDMSSPKSWQQQQALLQLQQRNSIPHHLTPVGTTNQLAHSNPSPLSQGTGSDRGVFSPPQGQSGSVGAGHSVEQNQRRSSTGHVHDSGGSGSHTPTEPRPSPHHSPHQMPTAEYYHHHKEGWGAGLPAHYPGVHGGYPAMYNSPIPGLPYPGPPGQPIPGANYPYAMPYPWGHQLGPHGDHMIQQQMQSGAQRSAGDSVQATRQVVGADGQAYSHSHPRAQHLAPAGTMFKDQAAPFAANAPVSSPPGGVASHTLEKVAPHSSSSPHQPSSLNPLGSSSHSIPHQLTHTLSRQAHSVSHEHLPHPSFPYSFEAGAHPSALHMWQQSQMPAQQIRPIPGMHPAHLTPSMAPHGLWYSSPHPHLVPGQELLVKKQGGKLKAGRPSGDKVAANRNSNNSNTGINQVASRESSGSSSVFSAVGGGPSQPSVGGLGDWGAGGGGSGPPQRPRPDGNTPLVLSGSFVPLPTAVPPSSASNQPTPPYDW
jgi:hypothetical protein